MAQDSNDPHVRPVYWIIAGALMTLALINVTLELVVIFRGSSPFG